MPSKAILEQKQAKVAEIAELLKVSAGGVVVNYQGITVDDDTKLRRELREAGVKYTVLKNSTTGRACDEVGLGDMKQYLSGMTAIAIGSENDPVSPAKILKKYDEKIESFSILAGYLEGKVVDASTVKALADIPTKEVLIATVIGSIQAPLYALAYTLQCVVDKASEEAPAEA